MPNYRIMTTAIVAVEVAPTTMVHITSRTNGMDLLGVAKRVPRLSVQIVWVKSAHVRIQVKARPMDHTTVKIPIFPVFVRVEIPRFVFHIITTEHVKILIFTIYKYQTIRI